MLEVWEGAPPRRQALALTMNSRLRSSRPWRISLNTTSAVISLERLAGATRSSAPFSNSTLPLSASIRMACAALVWKPSFVFGPDTGLGAAHALMMPKQKRLTTMHVRKNDGAEMDGNVVSLTAAPGRPSLAPHFRAGTSLTRAAREINAHI